MVNKIFFIALKFIAISQVIILATLTVSSASFLEETDDLCVYLGFNHFGTVQRSNDEGNYDLDGINKALAEHELKITTRLKQLKPTRKNNIALGCLTVIVQGDEGQQRDVIKKELTLLGQEGEEKLRAFESTPDLEGNNDKLLKDYSFEDTLSKVPELIDHINKIWGALEERLDQEQTSDQEQQIWKKFIDLQAELWKLKERLKNLIIQTALTNYGQDLADLAMHFTTPERNNHQEQAEILRDCVFINKGKSSSLLLENMEQRIANQKKIVAQAEKDFRGVVTKFYYSFWHSEQRLIHFLTSPEQDAFWDSLSDEINGKVADVFLHLHSHYDLCPICRRALSKASKKGGMLRKRIQDKLNLQEESFTFKVLASFRVHYGINPKDKSERKWLPHKVLNPEKIINKDDIEDTPSLYLKKIWMGYKEEREDNIKYSHAWKKHLISKSNNPMSNDEIEEYRRDQYSYINSLISNLEARINLLERNANA